MKKQFKVYSILFLSLFLSIQLLTGNEKKRFSHINFNQGLSNSTVMDIVQDDNQFMWFATFDGLNRFDGYSFTIYRHKSNKENSILSNELSTLFIDSENQLWIGSKDGLSHYISNKDNFENFVFKTSTEQVVQINAISEVNKKKLLIGTDNGVLLFDKLTKKFKKCLLFEDISVEVLSLIKKKDVIYIGTENGLYVYKISKNSLSHFHEKLSKVRVQTILPQSESRLWIGTEGEGLFLLNPITCEIIKNYQHEENNPKSLVSNYVRSLAFDDKYQLWIGTFNALSILCNGDDSFLNYHHNPLDNFSISQNSVRSIFVDKQGGIWLGTYYGGLNYYHPLKKQFTHIKENPYTRSLNDQIVSCISEDKNGDIWIGTNDKGINVYNPEKEQFTYFNKQNNRVLKSNNIKTFLHSKDNQFVYVGSHGGGLVRLDKKGRGNLIPIPNLDVYALTYDLQNRILIGTLNGLYRYDEQSQIVSKIELSGYTSKRIFYLKLDSKNRLWIGGEKSLAIYDLTNNQLLNYISKEYNDDSNNGRVNCVYEDSKNRIWIGSNGGLIQYKENGTFESYAEKEGLKNNIVHGILEDKNGRLWLSTNEGISCFIPNEKVFRNYSGIDGLKVSQFNNYSFCKSKSGLIYFGGTNGVVAFYPEKMVDNPFNPQPKISKISVFNQTVVPFDKTEILKDNIFNTKEIKLNPKFSNITIEFVVCNYLSGKHNTFAYRLEGVDKTWNYTSDNRSISYSNLVPGSYVFKVKAANSDMKWNETATELSVVVLPHWWQTWWARLLFLILSFGIGYAIYSFTKQRQLMSNQLRNERIEKEQIEELNKVKERFFINVSHEFRTPLTLILSPVQDMLDKVSDGWERSQLNIIKKNGDKMLHLVNQLMDYRRAELGVFELKIQTLPLDECVNNIVGLFEKVAKKKNIEYIYQNLTDKENFLIDPNYLETILSNLLSNAFKFTEENGEISVSVEEKQENLILTVKDSGCGIPKDKQDLIFDRFYQVEDNGLGSGIGLSLVKRLVDLHHGTISVETEVDKGTTFIVSFPQDSNRYQQEELDNKTSFIHTNTAKNIDFLDDEEREHIVNEEQEKTYTLLIVEDNEDVLEYLSSNLSEQYSVLTSGNGIEAMEKLKENEIDIILTDVMMPEMDGIRLTKKIKQNIRTCHIPIVILSAKSAVEDQLKGLKVGADDYVSKPFTFSLLNMKIQNMLKSRKRILEHYSTSLEIEPEKVTFNEMDKELLTKAKDTVMRNLDNPDFSTETLCSEMAMSRSNLHLKLKAITGESTISFIKKIKFNEASKLLLDGRYNVAEVSTMVGFNSPSYFTTSFKNYFGCLPTEYIKKSTAKQK